MIIVIDGPSGSGKSSTAKAVAEHLGIRYLDSGALYRVVTYTLLENSIPEDQFLEFLLSKDIRLEYGNRTFQVFLDGEDVTRRIRSSAVSDQVSYFAAKPEIRGFVNDLMRRTVKDGEFIADGRDLGTAVFPDADLKFYMNASLNVRAKRRLDELLSDGEKVRLEEVRKSLAVRDRMDETRETDPLKKPRDAIEIDTSEKTFDQQVQEICSIISENRR